MKKILLSFLVIMICVGMLSAQKNTGLIAYYPFDGNANDVTGNGKNGIVNGAALTNDRFANDSSAYFFDGIDDFIDLPYFFGDVPEFSISAWFYITENVPGQDITAIVSSMGCCFIHLQFMSESPGSIGVYPYSGFFSLPGLIGQSLGVWKHVVVSIKSGDTRIYQDGVVIGQDNREFDIITGTGSLRIGSGYGYQRFICGMIDDVWLFDRALIQEEVSNLLNMQPNECMVFVNPANQIICQGDSVTFNATATGNPTNYQWQKNGQDIQNATSPIFTIQNVLADDAGEYHCIATNDYGADTSNAASLTVEFANPTFIQGSTNVLKNDVATYSVAIQEGHTYEFMAEGGNKIDGTENSIMVHWVAASQGFVRLLETSEIGCDADTNSLIVNIGSLGIDDQQTQNLSVYPNPFNRETTYYYTLTEPSQVILMIYNAYGKLIDTPVNEYQQGGNHQVIWNAENLPPGVYYCRIETGNQLNSKKIIKMK